MKLGEFQYILDDSLEHGTLFIHTPKDCHYFCSEEDFATLPDKAFDAEVFDVAARHSHLNPDRKAWLSISCRLDEELFEEEQFEEEPLKPMDEVVDDFMTALGALLERFDG